MNKKSIKVLQTPPSLILYPLTLDNLYYPIKEEFNKKQ